MTTATVLRQLAQARRGVLVPGAFNALSARIIADLGYEALYITGAGVTNLRVGLPDMGFLSLPDVAEHTARIRDAVDLPLLVDADTGFGNAVNVGHTVRTLERSRAYCIQLEDQVSPKRCGHFSGKAVSSTEEMVGKSQAAVHSRHSDELLIMPPADARAGGGFEAAGERGARYAEAGADLLFVEALESAEEVQRLPSLLSAPLLMNMVIGGRTPIATTDQLAEWGYGLVLYANAALQGAVAGMQRALSTLKEERQLLEDPELVAPFAERQRLVGKAAIDELEQRYAR